MLQPRESSAAHRTEKRHATASRSAVTRARLLADLPLLKIDADVPLARLGRWRIGGPADLLVEPSTVGELARTLAIIAEEGAPHVVVGDGSNLLFDDRGFRGVVIKIGRAFGQLGIDELGNVEAGAGVWVPAFVRRVIGAGLAGATHAIGIPGSLGGLVTMNGGSQRRGIGDHVVSVDVLDMTGHFQRLDRDALDFAYRSSHLQRAGLVVVAARFRFVPGDRTALRREALAILSTRRAKFPKVRTNCGSIFVSDPDLYARIGPPGEAIERAGLKGVSRGDAQFSPDHANFIVNHGHARSADVLSLIHLARARVQASTGVAMLAEVRHVSPQGEVRPAHEVFDVASALGAPGLCKQGS